MVMLASVTRCASSFRGINRVNDYNSTEANIMLAPKTSPSVSRRRRIYATAARATLMMTPTLLSAMPARGNPRKFGIYYGSRFDPKLSTFDVLVLDADGGLDLVEVRRRAK